MVSASSSIRKNIGLSLRATISAVVAGLQEFFAKVEAIGHAPAPAGPEPAGDLLDVVIAGATVTEAAPTLNPPVVVEGGALSGEPLTIPPANYIEEAKVLEGQPTIPPADYVAEDATVLEGHPTKPPEDVFKG